MQRELAQELRDAGFPNIYDVQHRQGREYLTPDGLFSVYSLGQIAPPEDWFIPTLSELIAACERAGFSNFELGHFKQWTATITKNSYDKSLSDCTVVAEGGTPEEAVGRLWLALLQSPSIQVIT